MAGLSAPGSPDPRRSGLVALAIVALVAAGATACGGGQDSGGSSTSRTTARSTVTTTTVPLTTTTAVAPAPPPSRMLFVGDSVADTLQNTLGAEAAARGIAFRAATRPGCGILGGVPAIGPGVPVAWGPGCDANTPTFLSSALSSARPDTVVAFSTWESADRIVDGVFYAFGSPESDAMLLQKFDELRARMTSTGARLVLVTVPPRAATSERFPQPNPAEAFTYQHLNNLIRVFARDHPGQVYVADLARIACPAGPPCPVAMDGVVLRAKDGGHFDGGGPAWVAPRLLDEINAKLAGTPAQ